MVKVVISSSINIYRAGLELILSKSKNLKVVGQAKNHDYTISLVYNHKPQVLLLDLSMQGSSLVMEKLDHYSPNTKIVAISVGNDEEYILECIEAGVECYVSNETSKEDLINAIYGASKGDSYCSQKIAGFLLRKFQGSKEAIKRKSNSPFLESLDFSRNSHLTHREKQIATLLAQGLPNKSIALKLCIELSTVKNHVHNLLVKLDVKNRRQAVQLLKVQPISTKTKNLDLDQSTFFQRRATLPSCSSSDLVAQT